MTTRPLHHLAGAALSALLTATLLGAPPAAAAPDSTATAASAARGNVAVPKVGECHRLSYRELGAASDPSKPVPCTSRHTTQTIAVKKLTGPVNWNDKDALLSKISRRCFSASHRALGSTDLVRAQSAYMTFWFIPTEQQRARGAAWLRCDIALVGYRRLQPLPTDLTLSRAALTDGVRRCLTREGWLTICRMPHVFRSVGAYKITGGYPRSHDQALPAARRRCDRFVDTARFWFTYPSRTEWAAGSRAMVCYEFTSR